MTKERLNELSHEIHYAAIEKGFWDGRLFPN